MESKTKILGHSAHPILVVFPLGLLATSSVFDFVHGITRKGYFSEISFWMISSGLIGGLLAAPFGLIDWLSLPHKTRARAVGRWHGIGNVATLALFTTSWFMRLGSQRKSASKAYVFSSLGLAMAGLAGWLGGELVDRLGVGIDRDAGLNASCSLTRNSAEPPVV